LVDTTVLYAFWPINKQPTPLLHEVDFDDADTHMHIRSEAKKSAISDLSDDSSNSPCKT